MYHLQVTYIPQCHYDNQFEEAPSFENEKIRLALEDWAPYMGAHSSERAQKLVYNANGKQWAMCIYFIPGFQFSPTFLSGYFTRIGTSIQRWVGRRGFLWGVLSLFGG